MGERQRDLRERIILDIRKETGANNKVYKYFPVVSPALFRYFSFE